MRVVSNFMLFVASSIAHGVIHPSQRVGQAAVAEVPCTEYCQTINSEAQWPQFRGPNGRGVSGDNKPLPTLFGPAQALIWKVDVPRGCSSPCVWNDRILLTGFDSENKQLQTICLNRRDGQVLWSRNAPAKSIEKVHEINSPATPTPATDGHAIYVYFGSYGLLCYDFDGNEKWAHPLPIPSLPFGTGSSPIVAGDLVLLNVDQQGDSFLLAVNRNTGETAWKRDRISFQRGWATPVYVNLNGEEQVIVLGGQRLVAYNLKDGTERWWITGMPPFPISTPVVMDDRLFVSSADEFGESDNVVQPPPFDVFAREHDKNQDGKISRDEIPADFLVIKRGASDVAGDVSLQGWFFGRVDKDKDGFLSREEWGEFVAQMAKWPTEFNVVVMSVRLDGNGDVTRTHVGWRETRGVPEVPSPLCYENRLYLVKNGGILTCRDAQTGRLIYQQRLGAEGGYYASPIAGDGKVYAASDRGVITVITSGSHFELLAQNDLNEPIRATPAVAGGRLYIRTDQHLYAFGD
jgi:outer membrane protein assembly factor BamB